MLPPPDEIFFDVLTPLDFYVHVTREYWNLIITVKHPIMAGCEDEVKDALQYPEKVRRSRSDAEVYLFYRAKRFDRYICAVARQLNGSGFLITAYPTDAIKEGESLWPR